MSALPVALASRQRRNVLADATQGLGVSRGAHVSIRGGRFRLINGNGVETLLETHFVDLIIIDANQHASRIYFEGEWDPATDAPPLCFSDNGIGPSSNSVSPQAPTCQQCAHNIRGSDVTFSGRPTTACDNRKKVAAIVPDDDAINVYELQITPGSLTNFRDYAKWLGQQASGVEGRTLDIADVVTRISFDPDRQFVMTFVAVAFADGDRDLQMIQYIDDNKLSDVAVGRGDVPADPAAMRQMITMRGEQRIAAPVQSQERVPPPPSNGAAAPRQPRGRPARQPALVAPQGQAAPAASFMASAEQQRQPGSSAASASAPANPAQGTVQGEQGRAAGEDIPAFLRRAPTGQPLPSAPSAPPKFGVGQPPPPPAAIKSALDDAMNLPTRR